ncbi:MAG TPA: DUF3568 family protein [Planctomycetota bacterium]|nr:DUF3568 family protein [Planctomycetota bacterium]
MRSCSLWMIPLLLTACGSTDRKHSRTSDPDGNPRLVERAYGRSVDEVWKAAVATLQSMDFHIDDERHDGMGGILVARRGIGDRMTVEITDINEHRSKVSVQVDPGNGNLASTLYDGLLQKLGLAKSRTAHVGGNSAEGKYSCTLSRGTTAAEHVVRNLQFELLSIDVRQDVASIDARDEEAVPIRIRLTRIDNETSKVVFTVGTRFQAGARTTARQLKLDFERDLFAPVEQ